MKKNILLLALMLLAMSGISAQEAHEYVDLGLPSGTLWATCNIGANTPEENGDYFSWGETQGFNAGKTDFVESTYTVGNTRYNETDKLSELKTEDDVATFLWGSEWQMPSRAQQDELRNAENCTCQMVSEYNGKAVSGLLFTSKRNGNKLFLPAAGYRSSVRLITAGTSGAYWSRTISESDRSNAECIYFNTAYVDWYFYGRYYGLSVRAVKVNNNASPLMPATPSTAVILDEKTPEQLAEQRPLDNAKKKEDKQEKEEEKQPEPVKSLEDYLQVTPPEVIAAQQEAAKAKPRKKEKKDYVDLALPSGTLWATYNVGAENVTEYGDYFAWGETVPKENYVWSTLKYCIDGNKDKFSKYVWGHSKGTPDNRKELDAADDAAYVNWGKEWRMPTVQQMDELRDTENCTWKWVTEYNGEEVAGSIVTSKRNGKSIFFPAGGWRVGEDYLSFEYAGDYWSRNVVFDNSDNAHGIHFDARKVLWATSYRSSGQAVRPIYVGPKRNK